jgi:hypothetical protein
MSFFHFPHFSLLHTDRVIGDSGRHFVLYHVFFLVHTDLDR